MKKRLLLLLCIICTMAIFVGGTLAYFTDSVTATAEIKSAMIDIEQIEMERQVNNDKVVLTEFTQKQALYPAIYSDLNTEVFNWKFDEKDEKTFTLNFWSDVENALDKIVFVKNNSTTTAAFRTIFAFEAYPNFDKTKLLLNRNESDYIWTDIGLGQIKDTGDYYYFMMATYAEELTDGTIEYKSLDIDKVAPPSLLQVALSSAATNEDIEKFGETYEILVVTQATQAKYDAPDSVFNTDPKYIVEAVVNKYYKPDNSDSPIYSPNETTTSEES